MKAIPMLKPSMTTLIVGFTPALAVAIALGYSVNTAFGTKAYLAVQSVMVAMGTLIVTSVVLAATAIRRKQAHDFGTSVIFVLWCVALVPRPGDGLSLFKAAVMTLLPG